MEIQAEAGDQGGRRVDPGMHASSGKKVNTAGGEERPGMENMEKEVRIARLLITVSVIFGLFVVMTLLVIGINDFSGRHGLPGTSRTGTLILAAVKAAGIGFGLAAYRAITRGEPHRGGRYALIASVLPPLDLIALFAGFLALFSRREDRTG